MQRFYTLAGVPQGVGAATVTLIGLNAGSDITVVNPSGPAIDTSAPGQNSGAGAVVIATPGAITLEDNDSGSTNVIDTSGSQNTNTSGSQVFLASGKTTGPAITILASGAAGNIHDYRCKSRRRRSVGVDCRRCLHSWIYGQWKHQRQTTLPISLQANPLVPVQH